MSKEFLSLQYTLFSGELVDTRSESQKKKDKEHTIPQQMQMFKTPEMVQFGNSTHSAYREWLNQATPPPLTLEVQDIRTPEEIERDLMRRAETLTRSLFEVDVHADRPRTAECHPSKEVPASHSGIIFDAQKYCHPIGLRTKFRSQQIPVRLRSFKQ